MEITPKNYNGILIGTIFTIVSLLLSMNFIVPIISVMPGVFFETLAEVFVSNDPYSKVGKMTILLLAIVFLLTLTLLMRDTKRRMIRHRNISKRHIIFIMGVCYFIVHPLGFYIYWGLELEFKSDGQLIFGAVKSFPASSLTFFFIGLILDLVKNTAANKELDK